MNNRLLEAQQNNSVKEESSQTSTNISTTSQIATAEPEKQVDSPLILVSTCSFSKSIVYEML